MKILIALFLFIITFGYFESTMATNIDSLKSELKSSAHTRDSLIILKAITESYHSTSIDSALYYGEIAIVQAKKLNDTASLANLYNYLGVAYFNIAIYKKAIEYYEKSKEFFQTINDVIGLAKVYNNIGIIYEISGKNDIALDYYNKSLEIWNGINEQTPNDPEIKNIIASLYNNIGVVNQNLGKEEKALEFYNKSLRISSNCNNRTSMTRSMNNIGIVHFIAKDYDKALEYFIPSLDISHQTKNKWQIASSLNNIGTVYLDLKDYKKARKYLNESLQIAVNIKATEIIKHTYDCLYLLNKEIGNFEPALQYLFLYHQLNDSIYSQENKNKIAELEYKYEFEKKEQEIKLLETEQELNDVKLRNSRRWLYILIMGISITLILLFIIYHEMMEKTKSNKELVKKNMEIVRSENYNKKVEIKDQNKKTIPSSEIFSSKYIGSALTESQKNQLENLILICMEKEKPFLKSDFTIEILSKQINSSRTYVSQVINEKFNKHFNSFINEYRIKEARRSLSDPEKRNLTIETIAHEVGFGSKSTFNAAFKKYTGITPSYFYKSLKN